MKKILVPIANGTEEMEAVTIIDICRRAAIEVVTASDNNIVTCSRGVKIIPDILFDDLDEEDIYDAIIIPGGAQGVENLENNTILIDILRNHKNDGALIGAICAAPKLLSFHKIINEGDKVTSHPSVKNYLNNQDYLSNSTVVFNSVITSQGAGTAIEFALKIVELITSQEKAEEIKTSIAY